MKPNGVTRLIADYELVSSQGGRVKLSSLFGAKDELILVHSMGSKCTECSLWADAFNELLGAMEARVAFAVESPDPPSVQARIAADRAWKFRLVSSRGSPFRKDLGFEDSGDGARPGLSIFSKDAVGRIFQIGRSDMGPGEKGCGAMELSALLGDVSEPIVYH